MLTKFAGFRLLSLAWSVTLCSLVVVSTVHTAAAVELTTVKDTMIFQNNVNNSAGGQTQFFSGSNNGMSPRRGLIAFDILNNIPAGATITSVDLTLTLSMVAGSGMGMGGGSPTIGLHELTRDWGEGTVSAGSGQGSAGQPGDATWNAAKLGSLLWTTPGGDFDPLASASKTIVGTTVGTPYTWTSTPDLVADVQGWLDDPSSNFGWLLLNTNEAGQQTFRGFYSREIGNVDIDPLLVVNYTIPEPSTLVLLGLGSVALLWTRRRRAAR